MQRHIDFFDGGGHISAALREYVKILRKSTCCLNYLENDVQDDLKDFLA